MAGLFSFLDVLAKGYRRGFLCVISWSYGWSCNQIVQGEGLSSTGLPCLVVLCNVFEQQVGVETVLTPCTETLHIFRHLYGQLLQKYAPGHMFTEYSLLFTLNTEQLKEQSVHHSVQFTVYSVQCKVYRVQSTVDSFKCTHYNFLCIVNCLMLFTLLNLQCNTVYC